VPRDVSFLDSFREISLLFLHMDYAILIQDEVQMEVEGASCEE
jgi:hypothetical protein